MISFSNGSSLFQTLSQNSTAANASLYGQLANIEHRYLLQKYFANEGSYSIQTIGATSFSLASAVAIGSTSCTLSSAWGYQTTYAQLTFSDGEVVNALFKNGSTTVTWTPALVGTTFTLASAPAAAATTATLSTAWAYPSGSYLTSFSDGSTKTITFTLNSTAISWAGGLSETVGTTIYTSTIAAASTATIGGVQFYPTPPNYSKLKDMTITVGALRWTMTEVRTREEWDNLNVFPYYASIPSKFFIYPGGDRGGQIGIWPIPSTTGNTITFNYKYRVPELSLPDYGSVTYTGLTGSLVVGDTITNAGVTGIILGFTATNIAVGNLSGTLTAAAFTTTSGAAGTISALGTITATNGSTAVTGVSTAFIPTVNSQLESRWIMFPQPDGDGLWYQIRSIDSATAITLYQPYQGSTITTKQGFIIGQMPLIAEDFQDMTVWKALQYYFTSIVHDAEKVEEHKETYDRKLALLADYSGTNTVNVNLSPRRAFRGNPNNYVQKVGQTP